MLTIEERQFCVEVASRLRNMDEKLDKMASSLEHISDNLSALVNYFRNQSK